MAAERANVIEVKTSRTPDAARGAIAVAGGTSGPFRVHFGHYDQIKIELRSLVLTRLGPTWIPRSFSGMVRAEGPGTVVQGNVDWEPGLAIVVALRFPMFLVIIALGLYGLSLPYNPILPLLLVGFGLACLVVFGVALLCRRQVREDDEKRVRAFLEDALK